MDKKKLEMQSEFNPNFSATVELIANEASLKNYNKNIIKKIIKGLTKPFLKNEPAKDITSVLEFGAGIGTLANEFYHQTKIKPECIEIDPNQINYIQSQKFVCYSNLNQLTKRYDAIYSSNVLEHIEDDTQLLRDLKLHMQVNSRIAIYVPAFMCLWSQMDELVGHHRRYTKNELKMKVESAGLKVLSCYYSDSIGFFAWLYLKIKGYKTGDISSTTPNKALIFYDRYIYISS